MNTLVIFRQQPLCITKPSSWDQRSQPFYYTKINSYLPLSTASWTLHAQAKGFGGAPNSIQKKENAPNKSSSQEEEEDDDKIPSVVFDRMIRRIVTSVAAPMALGVVLLKLIDLLKEKQLWDVPLWVTFVTTFVFFGSSVLGVAYGSLSTSWDPEKNGSFLGFEEAKQNWVEMWKEEEAKN